MIFVAYSKTTVSPLLTHWRHCSLVLSYRFVIGVYIPRMRDTVCVSFVCVLVLNWLILRVCFIITSAEIGHSLKRKCHFHEIFVTGRTESCHNDNFQCSLWRNFHQNGNISVSMFVQLLQCLWNIQLIAKCVCMFLFHHTFEMLSTETTKKHQWEKMLFM